MTWPDWIFTALWLALWAGGLLVTLWALFADRARGKPRCDRCRYDLQGLDLPVACPECGRSVKSRRQALRTRRRWPVAFVGLVLVLSATIVWRVPEARARAAMAARPGLAPWALVPGPALVALAWLDARPSSSVLDECVSRLILERSVLDPALVRVSARALVLGRDTWPVGVPITLTPLLGVELADDRYPRYAPAAPVAPVESESYEGFTPSEGDVWLAPLPAGEYDIRFAWRGSGPPMTFVRRIRVRGTIEDVLTPMPSDEAGGPVRARLLRLPDTSGRHVQIALQAPAPRGYALALRATLERDDRPAASGRIVMDATNAPHVLPLDGPGLVALTSAIDRGDQVELARWKLVITGDPALALSIEAATHYWSGRATYTLPQLLADPAR